MTDRRRSPTTAGELSRRQDLVRRAMKDAGLDAILMQNTSDWVGGYVRWFTDVPAANGYPRTVIFYADAPMTLIEMGAEGGARDLEEGEDIAGVGRVLNTAAFVSIEYTVGYHPALAVKDLAARGARRVGIPAPGSLPTAMTEALRGAGLELSDATELVDTIKAVKSPEEIEALHAVARAQDETFAAICEKIRPGMTDFEVASLVRYEGALRGSDQGIQLGSSAPLGQSARFMDRGSQGRTIEKGDHFALLIEVNGPSGMYCEIARTMVLGKADAALNEKFAMMLEAQEHTLSLIKPGVLAADVARAHDDWMVAHGLGPERRLYAHGQGVDMVERPMIRADETMAFAENMCLAVHPGFDDGKSFNVVCDNYMVTADGVGPCMHKTEKKIFEL